MALCLLLDLLPQPWRTDALRVFVAYETLLWWAWTVALIGWPRSMARRKQSRVRSVGQGRDWVQSSIAGVVGAMVFFVAARFTEFTAFWTIVACGMLICSGSFWFDGRAILRDPSRAPVLPELTTWDVDLAAAKSSRVLPILVGLQLAWAASWWPLVA